MFASVLFFLAQAQPLLEPAPPPYPAGADSDVDMHAVAQRTADDEAFDDACKLLGAGELRAAADAFKTFVDAHPEHARAWLLYGYCVHMTHALAPTAEERERILERALEIHVRASGFEKYRPTALYNAACACALLGRTEDAFGWLAKSFAAGFDSRQLLSHDDDLRSLRSDPRFRKYLPDVEEKRPFIKDDVRVLFTFVGEAKGDQFGWEGRNAGDCDGDGKHDILLSAPYRKVDGKPAGKVYVYSGATGKLLFARRGKLGESLGIGIAGAGDVDADGFDDVIAGGTYSGAKPGRAYVFSGKDGSTLLELTAREPGDEFGLNVSGAGDLNEDGHADVVVGAPGSDESGTDAGRAYVFSGKDGSVLVAVDGEEPGDEFGGCVAGCVRGETKLLAFGAGNAGPGDRGRVYVFEYRNNDVYPHFTIEADATGAHLGRMFVSFVGDVDADDFPDVYASDWDNYAYGRMTGRIYVHSGRAGERLLTLTGENAGDGFGTGPGNAGDVDGDGHDDVIVGAWRSSRGAPSAGMCSVYSGADGSVLDEIVCEIAGDAFGFDAVGMGDLDGDGCIDFLITSAWSDVEGKKSGRAFVIAGPCERAVAASRER